MSTWPSVLSSITDPAATDRLNAPSHSSIESAQNDAIEKLETFIGTLSSAVGTLVYNIRAAASNGGGHVHTAVLGGTGQITYTKGDMLAAQSSSVLSKLAVGLNEQRLIADSAEASGVKWVSGAGNRVFTSVITGLESAAAETSLISASIPASTLGATGAVRVILPFRCDNLGGPSIFARLQYGGGTIASVLLFANSDYSRSVAGTIEATVLNQSGAVQRLVLSGEAYSAVPFQSSIYAHKRLVFGSSSVESGLAQTLGVTLQGTGSNPLVFDQGIIEAIN